MITAETVLLIPSICGILSLRRAGSTVIDIRTAGTRSEGPSETDNCGVELAEDRFHVARTAFDFIWVPMVHSHSAILRTDIFAA
jgi:hypothetical protein